MEIVISDTNIFIDLWNIGLLERFCELPLSIHTTDFIIGELKAQGVKYNPQNEMFAHFGTKRYKLKNETQLFKVIPHTPKFQKNRPASPERNTFEGS